MGVSLTAIDTGQFRVELRLLSFKWSWDYVHVRFVSNCGWVWLLGRSKVCIVKVIRRNALNPEGGGRIFPRNVGFAKRL